MDYACNNIGESENEKFADVFAENNKLKNNKIIYERELTKEIDNFGKTYNKFLKDIYEDLGNYTKLITLIVII